MVDIPDFILNKVFSADSLKLLGDKIEITFINLFLPIEIKDIPEGDLIQFFDVAIDDNIYDGEGKRNLLNSIELHFEEKIITLANIREFTNLTLPVGGQVKVCVPNPRFRVGETHSITMRIILNKPIDFRIERTVF